MGILSPICVTSDGKYNYGFISAYKYKRGSDATYDDPRYNVLIKSDADLETYRRNGWSFLSAISAEKTRKFFASETICNVDSRGVVTIVSKNCEVVQLSDNEMCSIQWDPNSYGYYTIGLGQWTLFEGVELTGDAWGYSVSTITSINNQTTALSASEYLEYTVIDKKTSQYSTKKSTMFLGMSTQSIMSIAYENDKLYIAGIDKNGNGLITTPLNLTELQNTTSEISPSLRVDYLPSDLPKGCPFSSRNEADMRVFGNSTYIMANCRAGDSIIGMNSTIYHHDGVNWTTPINLSNVPWGTSNGRSFRFIKSESGQVWLFISDSPYWYNEAYSIEIFPNNTVTWRSEKQITIDEEFTDYIPRTKKISKELTIGLSVGGGILFLVVVAILFLRYKKRKAGDAKSESNLENQPEVLPTTDVPLVVVNGKEEEREVLPATDAVAEVLPATDVVTEALPATNTVTEVLPATDTVTEVLPATDAVTEVLPTTDAPAIVVDGKEEESNRTT